MGTMKVTQPEDFHRSYTEAFNSGDIAALLDHYERDATFVPQPGQTASGHSAIGEALQRYQAVGKMAAETRYCVPSGDVALASASWQIKGSSQDGEPIEVQGTSADLLRRQRDGRWLLVVDHPWGSSAPRSQVPDGDEARTQALITGGGDEQVHANSLV
jgi:uncharacterized protein (TIGR02246 family)